MKLDEFMEWVERRHPGEAVYHQAVREVAADVLPLCEERPAYRDARVLERLVEPDRTLSFRVCWQDDAGQIQIHRGHRVQFCGAIGPYKGGLRFHPELDVATLKFLGFEQTLKNSLTTLPLGGAKGGADFDPKGRSAAEVMRFCQAFMSELHRHIGPEIDVPAGDIGVGSREIGFLFGQYRRIANRFHAALTGKSLSFGGSPIRPEATGYGCVYFAQEMLERRKESLEGLDCVVSGAGNVALHTAEKLLDVGARVITLSDSSGFVHDSDGIDREKLAWVRELKNERRGSLPEYAEEFGADFVADSGPWKVACDAAFPGATQNEIGVEDARGLVEGGCRLLVEGSNMPATREAGEILREADLLYAPSKAANAGGVAVSGLEITQNRTRQPWNGDEVNGELRRIMREIHEKCLEHGEEKGGRVDYVRGANVAGFLKVADALASQGAV